MSTTDPGRPEDEGPEVLAGEYVLGVLSPAEHDAAARRAAEDQAFAGEVGDWERRLTPLIEQIAPVDPPAAVWPAIAGQLGGKVVPFKPKSGYWNSLALWRGLAASSAAVAAACLVLVLLPNPREPVPATPAPAAQVSVARLSAPGGGVTFIATLDEAGGRLVVIPVGQPSAPDRSPQLWLMPADATPISLGVFMGQDTLVASAVQGVAPGAKLGVSLEPRGGSPTGGPTGPVIGVGDLMRL